MQRASELARGSLDTREALVELCGANEEALGEKDVLDDALLRAEVQNNLGAALVMLSQHETNESTQKKLLATALRCLGGALQIRTRSVVPREWAITKTNLALAHLQRYRLVGDQIDIMAGRVDVDLARAMFAEMGLEDEKTWAEAVRRQLLSAGKARS
ncbi:hypothetical protein [Devosia pacifica]|uniref:hypothetical protein n=1 Tax=Devosia pacifica TaxID=1335967 RepID=UPI00167BE31F|nr:hypothetical protein [Devosia pacifica]